MSLKTKLIGAAAAALIAAPAVTQAAPLAVIGGDTRVEVDAGVAPLVGGVLGSATVTSASPLTAAFPITGGVLDDATLAGQILHEGSGLRLISGGVQVDLTNFIIDTSLQRILADVAVNGAAFATDASVLSFDLSTVSFAQLTDLSNPQLGLFLTAEGATALNTAFGTSLSEGLAFGTAATAPVLGAAVPEPSAWMLMIGGAALTGAALRRRRLAAAA